MTSLTFEGSLTGLGNVFANQDVCPSEVTLIMSIPLPELWGLSQSRSSARLRLPVYSGESAKQHFLILMLRTLMDFYSQEKNDFFSCYKRLRYTQI